MWKKVNGQFNKINPNAKQKEATEDSSESVFPLTMEEESDYLIQTWLSGEVRISHNQDKVEQIKLNEIKTEVIHSDQK